MADGSAFRCAEPSRALPVEGGDKPLAQFTAGYRAKWGMEPPANSVLAQVSREDRWAALEAACPGITAIARKRYPRREA